MDSTCASSEEDCAACTIAVVPSATQLHDMFACNHAMQLGSEIHTIIAACRWLAGFRWIAGFSFFIVPSGHDGVHLRDLNSAHRSPADRFFVLRTECGGYSSAGMAARTHCAHIAMVSVRVLLMVTVVCKAPVHHI